MEVVEVEAPAGAGVVVVGHQVGSLSQVAQAITPAAIGTPSSIQEQGLAAMICNPTLSGTSALHSAATASS